MEIRSGSPLQVPSLPLVLRLTPPTETARRPHGGTAI